MLANGFVSMGGAEIGDLSHVDDAEYIRAELTESMRDRSSGAIGQFVGYWRRFLWEAQVGDLIVLPTRARTIAIGSFVGRYHFVANAEEHARHRRAVSWDSTSVPQSRIGKDLLRTIHNKNTFLEFKASNAPLRLRALEVTGIDPGP